MASGGSAYDKPPPYNEAAQPVAAPSAGYGAIGTPAGYAGGQQLPPYTQQPGYKSPPPAGAYHGRAVVLDVSLLNTSTFFFFKVILNMISHMKNLYFLIQLIQLLHFRFLEDILD